MKSLTLFILLFIPLFLFSEERELFHLDDGPSVPTSNKVDLVVFSFDRPLQLQALLESCERYMTGLNSVQVILRTSDKAFDEGYKLLQKRFSYVTFHKQSPKKNGRDFKSLVLRAVYGKEATARYVMFAVDDMIVTNSVNLVKCVAIMRKKKPWCFSLRLGKNIHLDTILNIPSPPPKHRKTGKEFIIWKFSDGKGAWNYPNSTDLTIYKKKDIRHFLKTVRYSNPNTLEGAWSFQTNKRKKGIAYRSSRAVNIPLNVVNPYWTSANMEITTNALLERFMNGEKIDITPFHRLRPYATHMSLDITFVTQEESNTKGISLTKSSYFTWR